MTDNPKKPLANLDTTSVLVSKAENGSCNAAQEALQIASEMIVRGKPLPKELAAWISKGLNSISAQRNAITAFDLRKRRGAPKKYSEEFERLVAESVYYSEAGRHKAINKDGTSQGAYAEVAALFGISPNWAEKFYLTHIESIVKEDQLRREFKEHHRVD